MTSPLTPILAHLRDEPSRTWSLIITLYGDAIVPRGGSVWLGTLLAFFQGLEIGDGVVRTAMSRLAADGWLERNRVGRNSFYRLRAKGRAPFEAAARRIYDARPEPWRGFFELVLPETVDRSQMEAAGCGAIAPGVWITPRAVEADGLRLRADGDDDTLRALAARAWPLARLGEAYGAFVATFTALRDFLRGGGMLSDLDALIARVLLIHEYRRVVLRDPVLPPVVLPKDWPGHVARILCAEVYRALLASSEAWLDGHAIDDSGAALPANRLIFERFSG